MPTRTKLGKLISFRYEPSYLADCPELRTDFRRGIASTLPILDLVYPDINLDGCNVVFSPSDETAVASNRIFLENFKLSSTEPVQKLDQL